MYVSHHQQTVHRPLDPMDGSVIRAISSWVNNLVHWRAVTRIKVSYINATIVVEVCEYLLKIFGQVSSELYYNIFNRNIIMQLVMNISTLMNKRLEWFSIFFLFILYLIK